MFQPLLNFILKSDHSGNATWPNFFVKRIFSLIGIKKGSGFYSVAKKFYRRTGSRIKIKRSFSFNGEDAVLARYLPESKGFYLDVGCGNPIYGSNTYRFYKRGWNGICVDPLAKLIRRHKIFRPRDQHLLGIIGIESATAKFYEYEESDYSTTSLDRSLDMEESGITIKKVRSVQVHQISRLNLVAMPTEPYLLDIDIEGSEMELLQIIQWETFSPRVISIEEWSSPIYEKTAVRNVLESKGYKLVSRAFVTSIYVHSTYLDSSKID